MDEWGPKGRYMPGLVQTGGSPERVGVCDTDRLRRPGSDSAAVPPGTGGGRMDDPEVKLTRAWKLRNVLKIEEG